MLMRRTLAIMLASVSCQWSALLVLQASRLSNFSEILRGKASFHSISAMGRIPAFYRTYYLFSWCRTDTMTDVGTTVWDENITSQLQAMPRRRISNAYKAIVRNRFCWLRNRQTQPLTRWSRLYQTCLRDTRTDRQTDKQTCWKQY